LVIKYTVLRKLIIKSFMRYIYIYIYSVLNIIRVTKVRRMRGTRRVVFIANSRYVSDNKLPRKRRNRNKRKDNTKTGLR
jgi:hypothetical protein